jgi:hypothetical protein
MSSPRIPAPTSPVGPRDNPHGVDPATDLIQTPPRDLSNWSENINFCCPSGQDASGVYAHMSRMSDDPGVWEGVLAVYLPGDTLLVSRSLGRSADPSVASTGPHTFRAEEPLHRWSMHFDGMARRVTRRDPVEGCVRDGSVELVQADLVWEPASPVWDLSAAMGDQPWGAFHLEQAVRVTGEVRTRDRSVAIDHIAFRDHTAGQRDYGPLDGEAWLTCAFPSGRLFAVLQIWHSGDVSELTTGFYYDGEVFHTIREIDVPILTSPAGDPERFAFSFDGPTGPIEARAELDHAMVFTLDEPIGMPLGTDLDKGLIAVEGPGRFWLDGEESHGWIERCRRVSHL